MKNLKKILAVVIAISLLTASFQMAKRFVKEQRNTVVEIVADLEDFSNLATELGLSMEEMTNKLIGSGVTSIAFSEQSLEDMQEDGKILLYSATDLRYLDVNFNNTNRELAEQMKTYIFENNILYTNATLVFTEDKTTYDFLTNSFSYRVPNAYKTFNIEGTQKFGILINRKLDNIKKTGLGLIDEDFEYAKSLGFNSIIPRIENHENLTEKEVDEIYNQLKRYKVGTVVFGGVTVWGHDYQDKSEKMLKYIGNKFSQPGAEIITAIIEKPVETDLDLIQRGIKNLSKYSKYVNTKVYSADANQLAKVSASGLVEQWGRAISQRNVRVLYVRPLTKAEKTDIENFEDTISAVKGIKDRIKYMGMNRGNAKGLGEIKQNKIVQATNASGVVAATFFLLLLFVNNEDKFKKYIKYIYALLAIAIMGCFAIYCIPQLSATFADMFNKVVAFVAAVVFPSIASILLIEIYNKYAKKEKMGIKKVILVAAVTILVSAIISVIGGLFVGGMLSESKYVLKIDVFRGVKLSFILPLLVFGFAFVVKAGLFCDKDGKPLGVIEQTKKLFETPITVKYGVVAGILALALAIIILRSGNTLTSATSSIEIAIRNFLERVLVARPRTKELVAFPVLMFLIYFANRYKNKELAFITMAVGMIGIEDIVNSFCHIRMPILVTTLSTIYSLIFGIIIGSIGIVIFEEIVKRVNTVRKDV